TAGRFHELIDDPKFADADTNGVSRVLLCSGKIYHELAARREENGRDDTAIIRVEQLYPFHTELARSLLKRYPASASIAWVQEEPRNMGAFLHIADVLREELGIESIEYIGRDTAASPAPGSKKKDRAQQKAVIDHAIGEAAKPAPEKARVAG
ncbi:MAG: multifunctional oxoglutarate decarboxylase/oxoglutarate dehydrogenase thiamine pyrophosphate-binding subunit/dihydrolipoyllysine-residue succinyltransferase subunit, partial [Planctomycetota bacterium]